MKKKNLRQILIPAFIITACIPIAIFTVISQARLKKSTLDNMNNQAEADLQKSNQCLNMTLDKYETILYDITTAEDFLNFAVTAKESADIMETDAYNMRSEFHISVTEIREWTGFSWYWQIEKESFMTGFLLLR